MKTMMMMGAAMIFAGGLGSNVAFAAGAPDPVQTYIAIPVVQASQPAPAARQSAPPVQPAAPAPLNIRQAIAAQLTDAGYSNVTVMPSSFYVHARNKAGDPVAMVIGPDSFTQVTQVPAAQTQAQAAPTQGNGKAPQVTQQ